MLSPIGIKYSNNLKQEILDNSNRPVLSPQMLQYGANKYLPNSDITFGTSPIKQSNSKINGICKSLEKKILNIFRQNNKEIKNITTDKKKIIEVESGVTNKIINNGVTSENKVTKSEFELPNEEIKNIISSENKITNYVSEHPNNGIKTFSENCSGLDTKAEQITSKSDNQVIKNYTKEQKIKPITDYDPVTGNKIRESYYNKSTMESEIIDYDQKTGNRIKRTFSREGYGISRIIEYNPETGNPIKDVGYWDYTDIPMYIVEYDSKTGNPIRETGYWACTDLPMYIIESDPTTGNTIKTIDYKRPFILDKIIKYDIKTGEIKSIHFGNFKYTPNTDQELESCIF